ncbi:hypothetical protein B1R94_28475 [Mycolicibacterium litorale]|nr:hypothetical protein B1R94_28475 [Mycolicibacterium litorale]
MQVHPDQMSISSYTVSTLIAEQFPQWAGLPVQQVASAGTVNAIFRIGREMAARFPLAATDDADARKDELGLEAAAADGDLIPPTILATDGRLTGVLDVGALWYYVETNPVMSRNCRRTLDRIVADN